jgi:hypothetical protein
LNEDAASQEILLRRLDIWLPILVEEDPVSHGTAAATFICLFLVYLTTLSIAVQRRRKDIDESGRGYYSDICLEVLRTTIKPSVRIAGFRAEI